MMSQCNSESSKISQYYILECPLSRWHLDGFRHLPARRGPGAADALQAGPADARLQLQATQAGVQPQQRGGERRLPLRNSAYLGGL